MVWEGGFCFVMAKKYTTNKVKVKGHMEKKKKSATYITQG